MSSEKTSSSGNDPNPTNRITAPPGSDEYERQFNRQASNSVHAIAKMPLVRVACGLLAIIYCLVIITASIFQMKLQIEDGFQFWELLGHAAFVLVMWWVISFKGRVALYGEFDTEHGLFAPRQTQA